MRKKACLVVSRAPHHPKERYKRPAVRASVREAFKAAAEQLKDFKELQRDAVKSHPPMFQGQVADIDADYEFILTGAGARLEKATPIKLPPFKPPKLYRAETPSAG